MSEPYASHGVRESPAIGCQPLEQRVQLIGIQIRQRSLSARLLDDDVSLPDGSLDALPSLLGTRPFAEYPWPDGAD